MLKLCVRLTALFSVLLFSGNAFAEGFALYEYSARGVALGGAVVARKPDPSALAYNPSLIARLNGIHLQAGVSAITPDGKMTTEVGGDSVTTGLKPRTWLVPHFYYTHQLSDRVTVGVGEFSRFGLGFEYPNEWPGRFNIYKVDLQTVSVTPTVAVAVTDKFSLGLGAELMYVTLDLNRRASPPLPYGAGTLEVDSDIDNADDYSYGFNVSGHYQFNDQWAAGLVYRSQMQVRAWGDIAYSNMGSTGSPMAGVVGNQYYQAAFHDGNAHSEVVMPDSIAGGISWTPFPELSIEAGAVWTKWDTFHALRIHVPQPVRVSNTTKHWDDSWRFNLGVEYQPLDWLTLRAGYVYDQSPMTEAYEDYLIPSDDRDIYSLGVGFKWDACTLDLAYAYIAPRDRAYTARLDDGVLKSKTKDTRTDIFSVTFGYEF